LIAGPAPDHGRPLPKFVCELNSEVTRASDTLHGSKIVGRRSAFGTINVGNRNHHYIEFHVYDLNSTAHAAASAAPEAAAVPLCVHSDLLFLGSSFGLMYSTPSGPIAVTCVT
jgi:hypothetical protein